MRNRHQLIESILHSFHAMRSQVQAKAVHSRHQNGITHSQWFVLKVIEHYKKRSIKDISETLGISSSAATQLVNGLVQAGLVSRQEDSKDRRAVQLDLSPKGKRHIAATSEKRITEMAWLFDALTDRELEEYLRLQRKILSKFLHGHKNPGSTNA